MLTDEDKVDLIKYVSDIMQRVKSDLSRGQLIALSHLGILRFIIDHPDVCASEIDEFFRLDDEDFIREYKCLEQKGMI